MAAKTFKVSLSLDNPRLIQTSINVRSFDKNSIQINVELTKDSQTYQIPSNAQIKISLLKIARQEQKIILDIPNTKRDVIEWIVPDYLDGYHGVVRVGVYLIVGSENIDVGYFNITSSVSDIDSAAEEFTESVLQGWAIEDLTELLPKFQSVLDETTGKDVISAPEIILARNGEADLKTRLDKEKQEVTAQLAQTMQQKADRTEVRMKSVKLELEDVSPTFLDAVEGGEGTSFNLLSIPQDNSVTFQKMDSIAGLNMYPFHKKATLNSNRTQAERIFNAIKDVKLYGANPLSKYRIGYLRKAHLTGGLYYWAIIIYADSNVEVCRFYETNAELISGYEGLQEIQLSERDNSGVTGKVIIDWTALGGSFTNTSLTYENTGLDVLTYNSLGGFLINEGSAW